MLNMKLKEGECLRVSLSVCVCVIVTSRQVWYMSAIPIFEVGSVGRSRR